MPRRIEIELTSARDDGTWTWRAAGAKEPRGTVEAGVLPGEPRVGDVLRVEAEFSLDGIEITSVVPPKGPRREPERLELLSTAGTDEPLVTTALTSRTRDDRRPRRDGGRRGRGEGRPDGGRGERRPESDRERSERGPGRDGERKGRRREGAERPHRRSRPEPPPMPAVERPKAKRLRPGRTHRSALLESLPEEQRPVAEQVVLGGMPAVRQAIEKQNAERKAAGQTPIAAEELLHLAERLVPKVRAAEWRDRAEAAQRDLDQLDLRDLRSVVSAADPKAKDPEVLALVEELKAGLARRVEAEHSAWLEELTATLDVGRIVRALRVSSRPPKAGTPLPPEVATRLTTMAGEALTADAAPERWIAVLDALAFSPVRDKVIPVSLPTDLHADVRATVARLATRIPKVAHIFEIEPDPNAPRPKPERRRPTKPKKKQQQQPGGKEAGGKPPRAKRDAEPSAAEAAPTEAPAAPSDAAPAESGQAPTPAAAPVDAPAASSEEVPEEAAPADAAPEDAAPAAEPEVSAPADAEDVGSQPVAGPQADDAQPPPADEPSAASAEPAPEPGEADRT